MRILSIIAAITLTVFAASSCGILGGTAPAAGTNATTNVTTGTTNGQAAGAALKALYTQYKADGNKLNMTNLTNIVNLTTLANNVQGLKGMSNKADFYKEFASGLVLGSNNLVTQNNSNTIMNGLQNLVNNVDLSGLQNKANNAATKGADGRWYQPHPWTGAYAPPQAGTPAVRH